MTFEEKNDPELVNKLYRRAAPGSLNRDGLPFWVSLAFGEDCLIHKFPGIRFSTEKSAYEGAKALVECGFAHAVFIHEDTAVLRPAEPF